MATINKQYPIKELESLFDKDKFYIKIFKEIFNAVTTNDWTKVSRTPTKIKNEYNTIRAKVSSFINEKIYEKVFKSEAYDSLLESMIDIYSVLYTVVHYGLLYSIKIIYYIYVKY